MTSTSRKKRKFYIYNEYDEYIGYTITHNLNQAKSNTKTRFPNHTIIVTETPINPWPFKDR